MNGLLGAACTITLLAGANLEGQIADWVIHACDAALIITDDMVQ